MLTWTACIATFDRPKTLALALGALIGQTRPPQEIVVVDASDDWARTRRQMEPLFSHSETLLRYLPSGVRSSAVQRNLALDRATSDIVMFFDDDSFLHDTCAEEIMTLYEADIAGDVAAVGATLVDDNPLAHAVRQSGVARKTTGRTTLRGIAGLVLRNRLGQWINRTVLFQSPETLFLRYDGTRMRNVPETLAGRDAHPVAFLQGCAMTARRKIAAAERFDPALRYYAAFEDLDFIYRVAAHGAVLRSDRARLHHFEAASGRIGRHQAIAFQLLNMAVFIKRHARHPDTHLRAYRRMLWRRILSECLKDGLSRRWRFPQVRGVLMAMRYAPEIWRQRAEDLDLCYPALQKRIMGEAATGGTSPATAAAMGRMSLVDKEV